MTPSTTTYSRGDVVFVPFRFTERASSKNRPAVIISTGAYHDSRNEVVIAGVTSNTAQRGFVGQAPIVDWQVTGLMMPSVVSGIIMTVHKSKIGSRIGALAGPDMQGLDAALRQVLGL